MTVLTVLLKAVALCGLAAVCVHYFRQRRFYRLGRKLPGPKRWPIVGHAFHFLGNTADILSKVTEITDNYDIAAVWIGPQLTVFLTKLEYVERFFTLPNLLYRSEHFDYLKPILGEGLITSNGQRWKHDRKIVAPTFRSSVLKNFLNVYKQQSDILVNRMQAEIKNSSFNVFPYIKNCTFDIICETALEVKLKSQTETVSVLKKADKLMELMYGRIFKVWQHSDFLFQLCKDGKEHKNIVDDINSFVDKLIEAKIKEFRARKMGDDNVGSSVFINQLLETEEYNLEDLRHHILTIVTAGYDTSASTISFLLIMLALHPEIQEKVYLEASEVHEALKDNQFNLEDVNKLKYLEMAIKETLRLFPTAGIAYRKATEDVQMGPYLIPKGAAFSVNMLSVHKDPKSFPDANKFEPDRFLSENSSQRNPYTFIPFGAGPRTCLGAKFAMSSMKVIASTLICKYKIETDMKQEDIQLQLDIVLRIKNGFHIRLRERQKKI